MEATAVNVEEGTKLQYREWHIVPDVVIPNHYTIETETGGVLCTLIFPGNDTETHTQFLNLIASAPELQDIAEMFRDSMQGNRAEKSMIFDIVCNVLSRLP